MRGQLLPFRVQHASTDPDRARRVLRDIDRQTAPRVLWWRVRRWLRRVW